jgi:hypothetical protein
MSAEWVPAFRAIVEHVPPAELPDLGAELGRADVLLQQRLTAPPPQPKPWAPDEWVDATQAGEIVGMSRSWCYGHRIELGGRHRGGAVRFSVRHLKAYSEGGQQ